MAVALIREIKSAENYANHAGNSTPYFCHVHNISIVFYVGSFIGSTRLACFIASSPVLARTELSCSKDDMNSWQIHLVGENFQGNPQI